LLKIADRYEEMRYNIERLKFMEKEGKGGGGRYFEKAGKEGIHC
jgi:hypothetical protein